MYETPSPAKLGHPVPPSSANCSGLLQEIERGIDINSENVLAVLKDRLRTALHVSDAMSGELTHSAMDRAGEARVRVYGDTAVFTARVTNTTHYAGRQFDADKWTTDVFVKRDGRWVCVLSHITPAVQP